jgi:hypothetical protein
MENVCLVNSFILELFSVGGFHLEEASELLYQDNKGIIFCINCFIVLTVSFFLLTIVITIVFFLCIFPSSNLQVVSTHFPLQNFRNNFF